MADALSPQLDALREDKDSRHTVRNAADSALNLATITSTELRALEKRVDALVGDGSGDNGQISSMQRTIRKTETDVSEIKGDLKGVVAGMAELKANTAKSNTFMDGWKGVAIALSIGATLISVIGGIAAALFWLYKH